MTKISRLTSLCILCFLFLPACATHFSQLSFQKTQSTDDTISIISLDHQSIKDQMFGIAGTENNWQEMLSFLEKTEGSGAWITISHIESLDLYEEPYSTNPNRLPPQRSTTARSLICNRYFKPHSLRIIFMIDYQQVPVVSNGQSKKLYYDLPVLQPKEEFALEYIIPPLSAGLHHFTILLITDPESESDDLFYRFQQQLSFGEQRYSLWVGVQELDQADNLLGTVDPPSAPVHYSRALQLPRFLDPTTTPEERSPIHRLQLKAGTVHKMDLTLTAPQPEENSTSLGQTFPVLIGVFWNDEMREIAEYHVPILEESEHEITLPIHVPEQPRAQQMMVVVFGAPYNREFDNQGQRILYPKTGFTQRILVEITP